MKSKSKSGRKNEEYKLTVLKKRVLQEKQTLFLIVHDEAHSAPGKDTLLNQFINDKDVSESPNIILLQVSATPYSLMTKNSRIPDTNHLPWFTKNDASEYFGTKDFVKRTQELDCAESDKLVPGAMVVDSQFEQNVQKDSAFEKYLTNMYKQCLENKTMRINKTEKNDILRVARLHGLLMQYMKAMLEKANIPPDIYEHHFNDRSEALSVMTKEMVRDIDNPSTGEGKMILLRVIEKIDGKCFAKVLRKMRAFLNLDKSFSVVLDIESDEDGSTGMDNFTNEERQFLPRLQCWNDEGNPEFRPSSYKDLKNLPVILIVCERGKLGITYPTTLRWYDLRIRYNSLKGVTRAAIEQDFGRACRYKTSEDLPTILVSRVASTEIFPRKRISRKVFTILDSSSQSYEETVQVTNLSGVHKLIPDYQHYMKPVKGAKKQIPSDDLDLTPYKSWLAGDKNCDHGNLMTYKNRYLLVGRPQIGKTGAFLHLAFVIWNLMKRPENTGAHKIEPTEILEWDEEDDESNDDEHFGRYPALSHIKSLRLQKPSKSLRYGDPNNPDVQKWYLKEGNTYPFPKALETSSSLTDRIETKEKYASQNISKETVFDENFTTGSTITLERIRNKCCSKSLIKSKVMLKEISEQEKWRIFKEKFYHLKINDGGTLLRQKESFELKWESKNTPNMNTRIRLPPILIPSSGRASTALLDLSDTMEGSTYIQILVIREEEMWKYISYCIQYKEIDILIINNSQPKTVGASRYFAKRLGERITESSPSKFVFLLDDNILCWTGVTLINDPCPLFDKDPSCKYSQATDISLHNLLSHMALDDYTHVKDFSIIGFSLTKRRIKSRKNAYGRMHVFGAYFLNLSHLRFLEYRKTAWAMEDVDFNWRTDKLSGSHATKGLIVKCRRYVGTKKPIMEGGVVPRGIPDHILPLLQRSREWNYRKEIRKKVEAKNGKETRNVANESNRESFKKRKTDIDEKTKKTEKNPKEKSENKDKKTSKEMDTGHIVSGVPRYLNKTAVQVSDKDLNNEDLIETKDSKDTDQKDELYQNNAKISSLKMLIEEQAAQISKQAAEISKQAAENAKLKRKVEEMEGRRQHYLKANFNSNEKRKLSTEEETEAKDTQKATLKNFFSTKKLVLLSYKT